jgi:Lhr-like helicases
LSYPMPTDDRILIERWKEYTIVHSALGTKQNRALSLILGEEFGGGESITTSVDPYRIILKTQPPFENIRKVIEKRCEKSLKRTVTRTGIFKKNFLNVLRKCGGIERGADLGKIGIEKIIRSYEGSMVWKEAMKTTMFKDFEPISKKEFEIAGVDGLTPLGKIALENLSRKYDIIKPERMKKLIVEYTKARLLDEAFTFLCCDCYSYIETLKIKNVKDVVCPECGSKRIGFLKESEERVERGLFRGKREELKKEANENCDLLQEHGPPFLLVMAARIKKERSLRLLTKTKKIDLLIPLIINEERKELRRRFG